MLRFTIHITYDRRLVIPLAVLILALLLAGSAAPPAPAARAPDASAVYVPRRDGRHVYLTDIYYLPYQAPTSCADGYHMASFWEIYDVSNLVYDYDHPKAYTRADSGKSLPVSEAGWVRTGNANSTSSTPGTGNCNGWNSINASHYGTAVWLTSNWTIAPSQADFWEAATYACTGVYSRIWCARDSYQTYIPLVFR